MPPARHPLLLSLRWLLPFASLLSLALGVMAHSPAGHVAGLALAVVVAALAVWQQRNRPVLVVDDDGYAIEQNRQIRFRVLWSEVKQVRADAREQALYIDCGDPARNLLVPPARGYGFHFAGGKALYARIVSAVGDRVVQVERLDDGKASA